MTHNAQDAYEYFGTHENPDAKAILDAFEKRGIWFDVALDDSQIKKMNAVVAGYGGTFGHGTGLAIVVHADDMEKAIRIRQSVLKNEV